METTTNENRVSPVRGTLFALLASAALALLLPGDARAHGDGDSRVVIEWNEILETAVPANAALAVPRYYAMMHIAMFDAVNSIEREYSEYRVRVRVWHGASREAAAAQAAHDILFALIPNPESRAAFRSALDARLARIHPTPARLGARVGQAAAKEILAWREKDGWSSAPPSFVLPAFPGEWQPTPPGFLPAGFTQLANVTPFALLTSTQYLPRRPPALTSEEYAKDLEEVKQLGSATSGSRTKEQTQLAHMFASVGYSTVHFALWNNITRGLARSRGLSLIETARVFALLNASLHDGVQTSHTSKFAYGLWRPVTAIQRADEDLNPLTSAEPSWMPLLTTPPYPSHAGNMACVGASAARSLALFFETDEVPFTATWLGTSGNPNVSRQYAGFWQLAQDQARSREVGGIHFPFESRASQEACVKVATYVFENYMLPKWKHDQ